MARINIGSSTFELFGKAVVRQFPYIPFPFHRTIPHETSYEFFLLQRKQGSPRATIVRQWVFQPADVIVERDSHGGVSDRVGARLQYDNSTRTVTIAIVGLKQAVVNRVDLTLELTPAPR